MHFKQMLSQKTGLAESLLPAGYQQIGKILLLNLKPESAKYKKQIGEAVLELVPYSKTVCLNAGKISGKYRKPKIEFLAGEKNFGAEHIEQGCVFSFDVRKIMWSKGNVSERQRIAKIVQAGETVIDFFAGIGYWSIPIGKHSKAKKIYSIEMNPTAVKYLKKNIKLNKIPAGKIVVLKGDCTKQALKVKEKADRIILGLLPSAKFALPSAMKKIKSGGTIHYEGIAEEGKENILFEEVLAEAKKQEKKAKLLNAQKVKSYAPHRNHYTLDVRID